MAVFFMVSKEGGTSDPLGLGRGKKIALKRAIFDAAIASVLFARSESVTKQILQKH